jgi:hypothetical protein
MRHPRRITAEARAATPNRDAATTPSFHPSITSTEELTNRVTISDPRVETFSLTWVCLQATGCDKFFGAAFYSCYELVPGNKVTNLMSRWHYPLDISFTVYRKETAHPNTSIDREPNRVGAAPTKLYPPYKRRRCDPRVRAPFLRHAPLTERKASKLESANSDATTAGASGYRYSNSARSHHQSEGGHRQRSDRYSSHGER